MNIPDKFFKVKYKSSRIPGVDRQSDLTLGANCQVFAYALLAENGVSVPNFRSSELWRDEGFTTRVETFKPLDILLYNNSKESYGAHVAVYIGDGKLIHLSADNVYAEITTHENMLAKPKYINFIGAKRVL